MTQPSVGDVGLGIPRMALGSDGSKHYEIFVDSEGVLRVRSSDGDKIFGFESIVEEQIGSDALTAGTNSFLGTAVPSGKVRVITQLSVHYIGTPPTYLRVLVSGLASGVALLEQRTIVSDQRYPWSGEVHLQAGDQMQLLVSGATLNDDAYLRYAGYQMNAP